MRKETDLRQVKATARALRMLDIGETDFWPMIIKHPFTDSGIPTQIGDEILYLFTCKVNTKGMTDDVLAQCFYEGGSTSVYTYSVKACCDHVLKNSSLFLRQLLRLRVTCVNIYE